MYNKYMAKLRFHNKEIDKITDIEIHGITAGYAYFYLHMQDGVQQKIKIKLIPETEFLLEMIGSIVTFETSAWIKGTVTFASAGSGLFCTMGKSRAKSTDELQKETDKRNADIEESLGSLFKNMNFF